MLPCIKLQVSVMPLRCNPDENFTTVMLCSSSDYSFLFSLVTDFLTVWNDGTTFLLSYFSLHFISLTPLNYLGLSSSKWILNIIIYICKTLTWTLWRQHSKDPVNNLFHKQQGCLNLAGWKAVHRHRCQSRENSVDCISLHCCSDWIFLKVQPLFLSLPQKQGNEGDYRQQMTNYSALLLSRRWSRASDLPICRVMARLHNTTYSHPCYSYIF